MNRKWNSKTRAWFNAGGRPPQYASGAERARAWRKRNPSTEARRAANAARQSAFRKRIRDRERLNSEFLLSLENPAE